MLFLSSVADTILIVLQGVTEYIIRTDNKCVVECLLPSGYITIRSTGQVRRHSSQPTHTTLSTTIIICMSRRGMILHSCHLRQKMKRFIRP
ncbi:MAG: hypothetical protein B6D34_10745 [Candidatus Brocadia sp. UTAMX1]|nr:MAG: hypothetical protein B6D34_10745 [Candidatus Brocadia sp. UTAMX1]